MLSAPLTLAWLRVRKLQRLKLEEKMNQVAEPIVVDDNNSRLFYKADRYSYYKVSMVFYGMSFNFKSETRPRSRNDIINVLSNTVGKIAYDRKSKTLSLYQFSDREGYYDHLVSAMIESKEDSIELEYGDSDFKRLLNHLIISGAFDADSRSN